MYCENCGNKITDDSIFCENCGHRISTDENNQDSSIDIKVNLTIFETADWKKKWLNNISFYNSAKVGIILTNTGDCTPNHLKTFKEKLHSYLFFAQNNGITYFVLDLATQKILPNTDNSDLNNILAILRSVYDLKAPEYLLIIGDRTSVPSAKWINKTNDFDEYVDSDLCYFTLDTQSPFEKKYAKFYSCVGRLPASGKTGFAEAVKYFENVMHYNDSSAITIPVTLSEKSWLNVSKQNFKKLNGEVYSCPPNSFVQQTSTSPIRNPQKYNLLCFNLHGSSTSDNWLSNEGVYGYSPQCLANTPDRYIICTEACYGAKPNIRSNEAQSLLVTAMENGCLAFCGSSQIAYGISDSGLSSGRSPCAADVLVGKFAEYVYEGCASGPAYLRALTEYIQQKTYFSSEETKTMASFGLYGDPSLSLRQRGTIMKTTEPSLYNHTTIVFPDVRTAVNKRLSEISDRIAASIDKYIKTYNKEVADIMPSYYELTGHKGYLASFQKKDNNKVNIVNIYVDDQGNIQNVYVSK